MSTPSIHIVGAGISGLVCALELERAGYEPIIHEASDKVGGRLRTDLVDGFPLDHGFQVLLTAYPAARKYLDIKELDLRNFRPGAIVFRGGKASAFGDFTRDRSFLSSTLFTPVATVLDKFNTYLLSRRLRSKKITDIFDHSPGTTIDYLQAKGFSKKIIDNFFIPFYGGIFLEKKLSTPASMFAFTFKMFGEGHAAIPSGGIEQVAMQLKGKLNKTTFHFNSEVESVNTGELLLASGEKVKTDAIIWTCPPRDLEPELSWHSCSTHYFYADKNVLNSPVIGLLPEAEFVNSFHYITDLIEDVKSDKHMLSATVAGRTDATIDDVVGDLESHAGITNLKHIKSYKVEHALPDLTIANYAPKPEETRMMPGVYRAGDAMANASLNAAMESGKVAADTVLKDLLSNKA